MDREIKEELESALEVLNSIIMNCEKMQFKFKEGTSQATLLKNRIKALYISKSLIEKNPEEDKYIDSELVNALAPICSIINKCEKAQEKAKIGSATETRLKKIIRTMEICKLLIEDKIFSV